MGGARFLFLFCATAFLCLFGAPQAAAQDGSWLRAESDNFVVYSRGRERALRSAVQRLEHFDDLIREVTGANSPPSPTKLTVYLLPGERALRVVLPDASEALRGYYTYRPEFVAAFAIHDDGGWEGGAQQILFHEYTHRFMMQYFTAVYPAWYVEGFAEYLSTVEFERGRTTVGRPGAGRATTLVRSRTQLLPIQAMLAAIPERDEEQRQMFYAQSWLMVHYAFSRPERQRALNAYLLALGQGGDPVQAFETAFGMPVEEFGNVLQDYMRGSIAYTVYPNREFADTAIAVSRMPRSADDLLLLNARMRRGVGELSQLADQILQEAALYPDDAYAIRSAAYAELVRNPVRARELIAPLVEVNPEDVEAQYIMGRSFVAEMRAGEASEDAASQARRHFARAFRIDPNHVPTLYYYAQTYMGSRLSDEVLNVLMQAHLLAPQVDEIRFNLAIQLLNLDRFAEAASLLGPIAYSPHGGEGADRARRYLEAARRGEMPEP